MLEEIKKYCNCNTILDIGCGDSYFDYQLMNKVNSINKFYGIDIFTKEEIKDGKYTVINDYKNLKDMKFDTILMFDVLEHIENDSDFMKDTVMPLLKDNGRIVMTVPAYQSLFSKHDEELKHYRRYDIKMICDVAKKSNFRIINYSYKLNVLIIS